MQKIMASEFFYGKKKVERNCFFFVDSAYWVFVSCLVIEVTRSLCHLVVIINSLSWYITWLLWDVDTCFEECRIWIILFIKIFFLSRKWKIYINLRNCIHFPEMNHLAKKKKVYYYRSQFFSLFWTCYGQSMACKYYY